MGKQQSGHILVYSKDGALIDTWADLHGRAVAQGMCVDPAGNLLIADGAASRIVVLDSTGTFLTEWNVEDGPGAYPGANGVLADASGNVYVSSRLSASIRASSPANAGS